MFSIPRSIIITIRHIKKFISHFFNTPFNYILVNNKLHHIVAWVLKVAQRCWSLTRTPVFKRVEFCPDRRKRVKAIIINETGIQCQCLAYGKPQNCGYKMSYKLFVVLVQIIHCLRLLYYRCGLIRIVQLGLDKSQPNKMSNQLKSKQTEGWAWHYCCCAQNH